MKTRDTLTKEQKLASEWFTSKSYLEQHGLSDKYFESRNPSLLTIEQVEQIWRKECNQIEDEFFKPNQKQFKQFDESLFKAYIFKFSEEDKEKCFEILMRNLDIQKAELINDGINLNLVFVKF